MLGLSVGFDLSGTFPLREVGEGVCWAFGYAGWFLPKINTLDTETAFSHHVLSRTEFGHVKGTRLYAITATDASLSIVLHHTILPAMECPCRAGGDTGRVLAVKTGEGDGTEARFRKSPCRVALHPAQLHTGWCVILQLTSHLAGVAANAFFRVKEDESFHENLKKMYQNTPQLCWGDEWPALSPQGRGLG